AVGAPEALARIAGEPTTEPVYGLAARWIGVDGRARAEAAGALAFDAISILGSHLAEIVRAHAAELVGRQEFQTLLEHLRASVPTLVKDVGSELLPIGVAHRAFCHLLRERTWPRDPIAVFEAFVDAAPAVRDPREIAEAARRVVVPQQLRRDGVRALRPLILDPAFETELARMWSPEGGLAPDPATAIQLRERVATYAREPGFAPHALVVTAPLRPMLAEFLERVAPGVAVYGYTEVPIDVQLTPAAVLALP
ncbi:MAG: FHIPEP family type III secretion protein, partial [Vulcanimicrobiaceae bacterium]